MSNIIKTAYNLPYKVYIKIPHPIDGVNLSVRIITKHKIDDNVTESMSSLITTFCILATTGALGGDTVIPWESGLKGWSEPRISDCSIEWDLFQCRLDKKALVILSQLFLLAYDEFPVTCVDILVLGCKGQKTSLQYLKKCSNPYPPLWKNIPFDFSINDNAYGSPVLYVTFSNEMNDDEKSNIDTRILTWAYAISVGLYGIAPIPPQECSLLTDEEVTFVDNEMEFAIDKFHTHTDALYGLVNVCSAIHKSISPISYLLIE